MYRLYTSSGGTFTGGTVANATTFSSDVTFTTGVHVSGVADGASAKAFTLNSAALSNSGAKLLSIQNNSSEKAYFDKDGKLVIGGAASLSSTTLSAGAVSVGSTGYGVTASSFVAKYSSGWGLTDSTATVAHQVLATTSFTTAAKVMGWYDGNPGSLVASVDKTGLGNFNGGIRSTAGSLDLPKTSGKGVLVDGTFGWKDIIGDISPRSTGVGSPTLAAFRGGSVRTYFYNTGDTADCLFHLPHDYAPGTDLYLHIHWAHNGTAISGSLVLTFAVSYAKGHNQANFSAEIAPTLTVSTPDIATVPQYRHRVDEFQLSSASPSATQLDSALLQVDGLVLVNLTATTIPTITGGTTNLPTLLTLDLHYQSTGVPTKNKAPDFYA